MVTSRFPSSKAVNETAPVLPKYSPVVLVIFDAFGTFKG
jgi:hypothetical protein